MLYGDPLGRIFLFIIGRRLITENQFAIENIHSAIAWGADTIVLTPELV